MSQPTTEPPAAIQSSDDSDGAVLRIDGEVFEALTVGEEPHVEGDSPLIVRWLQTWSGGRD